LAVGWLLFGITTDSTDALLVSALFLCFTGTVNAQFFSVATEQIVSEDEPRRNMITSTLRGGNAVGYVIGPALASFLARGLGLRTVFVSAAILYILAAGSTLWLSGTPLAELQIDKDAHVHWLDKDKCNSGEWGGTTRETIRK